MKTTPLARFLSPATAALAGLLFVTHLDGQTAPPPEVRPTAPTSVSRNDRTFLTKAAELAHAEVSLAQLAERRAQNPHIRGHAQKLLADYRTLAAELAQLGEKRGIALPKLPLDSGEPASRDRIFRKLTERSEELFDAAFLETITAQHQAMIALFEKLGGTSPDAEIAAFTHRNYPKLREHLMHTENLGAPIK
jgi:putative membrane protein